jgi:hypothetical protein
MAWIKRNLYFVITVVVGLGVAGYCGYLLYSALDQNKEDSTKFFSDNASLDTLKKKKPFPDSENIKAAEADAERVRTFLAEFRKPFAGFPVPPKMDDQHFHEYLQNTIVQFRLEATNAGVGLPAGYAFSFAPQMTPLNYASESIAPWMQQLTEIKAILHILYGAKINYLERIKRPTVTGEDMTTDDYLQMNTVSNTWGMTTPYMINFRSFSAEIANVLAGFAASSNYFVVKTIHVEPSREPLPQLPDVVQPETPAPVPQYRYQPPPDNPFNPFMQGGPGRGNRERRPGGLMPPVQYQYAPAVPPPAAPTGPATILRETPLFVTIYIDVVKLKAPEAPAPAPAATARPSRRGER